jgi:hypothetical protein
LYALIASCARQALNIPGASLVRLCAVLQNGDAFVALPKLDIATILQLPGPMDRSGLTGAIQLNN